MTVLMGRVVMGLKRWVSPMVSMRQLSYAVLCSLFCLACGDDVASPGGPDRKKEVDEQEAQPGTLVLLLRGLPDDVPAGILVRGPEGSEKVVNASEALADLEAGAYRVEAMARTSQTMRYTPTPEITEVEVKEGEQTKVEIVYTATDLDLFELHAEEVSIPHFGTAEVVVEVKRHGDWNGRIELRATEVPVGYSADEVTVPEGESAGIILLTSTGSARRLSSFSIQIEGEGAGKTKTIEVLIRPSLIVSNKKDGARGSLRSLVEILPEFDWRTAPTITFDEKVFAKSTTIELDSTLELTEDAIIRGIPGGRTPRIALEGDGESFTPVVIAEGVTVEISNLGLRRGRAAQGGVVANFGTLTLKEVHISDGYAEDRGGGIYSKGTLHVEDSTIEKCKAEQSGGGIHIEAAPPTGTPGDIIWEIPISATVVRTLLIENESSLSGGGISVYDAAVEIDESRFLENSASREGGGLYVSGSARVFASHFEKNHAGYFGGGGIYSDDGLFLISSTVQGNTSESAGGGIILGGSDFVFNSTIVGNGSDSLGGGVVVKYGAFSQIVHCTIAHNKASGGAGIFAQESELMLGSSILWGNGDEDEYMDILIDGGIFNNLGHNVIGSGSLPLIAGTDRIGVDPLLLPLGNYGGPTQTIAVDASSVAVDAIPSVECLVDENNLLAVDQRGFPRPAGEGCDIGAYEVQ